MSLTTPSVTCLWSFLPVIVNVKLSFLSNFDAEQFGKLAICLFWTLFSFFLGFGKIFIENLGSCANNFYYLKTTYSHEIDLVQVRV